MIKLRSFGIDLKTNRRLVAVVVYPVTTNMGCCRNIGLWQSLHRSKAKKTKTKNGRKKNIDTEKQGDVDKAAKLRNRSKNK